MIAGTDTPVTPRAETMPRAFEPGLAASLDLPETRPGWDVGPERRIDDGRSLRRMLAFAAIGLALFGIGAALMRDRSRDS